MAAVPPTDADRILALVDRVRRELRPAHRHAAPVALDSSLERDLGLDSIGRAALVRRIEHELDVALPDDVLASCETPRDLLREAGAAATRPAVSPEIERLDAAPATHPSAAATLVEALEWHTRTHPDRVHIRLLSDDPAVEIRYGDLLAEATSTAGAMVRAGLEPGRAVALMLPTCRHYYTTFFATLMAGAIPVPIYPPARPSQLEDHLRRQVAILDNAQATLLVTVPEALAAARFLTASVATLRTVTTGEELARAAGARTLPARPRPDDLALIQYTSGSTSIPKGVMLSHASLLANIRAMGRAACVGEGDIFVSWLPLYHDMGLIGAWLGSLVFGMPLVAMSPLRFLARPARWLRAIHDHHGTLSAAPNFAYELCVDKIDADELSGIELASWRLAFNGAEPVSHRTVTRFVERFRPHGFRAEAMCPVYGLAESGLGVTFPLDPRPPLVDAVDGGELRRSGRAVPAPSDASDARRLVACGQPLLDHEVRIVGATGAELPERHEGRIQFRGPSATTGYFRNPVATAELVVGTWRETGDLGYLASGDLYVTGRSKDLLIRAGRNIHPQELEESIGLLRGARRGAAVVFGAEDPTTGAERIVAVVETRLHEGAARARLREEIELSAQRTIDASIDDVVLVDPGTIPKTSSGKLRRGSLRELYLSGRLAHGPKSVRWQLIRLACLGMVARASRAIAHGAEWVYAARALVPLLVLVPAVALLVLVVPGRKRRRALTGRACRLLVGAMGLPFEVAGLELVPGEAAVLAPNHSSYLDPIVLMAGLSPHMTFVAKGELRRSTVMRALLGRIGTLFVDRFDARASEADLALAEQALGAGERLVVFPEGTFHRTAGLLPFHAGAFLLAARCGVPVVPVAIRGTRQVLRAESGRPRRAPVSIVVGTALRSRGRDLAAAGELRDRTRAAVLALSGEVDLDHRADLARKAKGARPSEHGNT